VLALVICVVASCVALSVKISLDASGGGSPGHAAPAASGSAPDTAATLVLSGATPPKYRTPSVTAAPATMVAQVAGIPTLPASILNPNDTPARYQVYAADLGTMWDGGDGTVRIVFGDTFGVGWQDSGGIGPNGYDSQHADWRCSTMGFSSNRDLAQGLLISDMVQDRPGHAGQLLPCSKGKSDNEETFVPTSGVHVGSIDYLASMSVVGFTPTAGVWHTNFSQISYSLDGGQSWIKSSLSFPNNAAGTDHFQMLTFAQSAGYVYVYGTQNGRFGPAYMARVPDASLLDPTTWQYWTAHGWRYDAEAATVPVVPGPVGELSVDDDTSIGVWLMTYLNQESNEIVLRTAPGPTGPWSAPQDIADSRVYPGLYGGFIHPWSSGTDLYFVMSVWGPYQTYLMHSKLTLTYR
jgi:hypothetical protein